MIVDYASLQQAVADWLARADLTAQIPTFIQMAEARLNRDLRLASQQLTVTATVAVDNTIRLPDNCREVQSLRIAVGSSYVKMHPLPPERLADSDPTTYPIGYVTVGNTLQLLGGNGTTPNYALTYFQAIPNLGAAPLDVNWLILREPGLYLYATLIEASPYLRDTAMAQVWATQYDSTLKALQVEDDFARYGPTPAQRCAIRSPP